MSAAYLTDAKVVFPDFRGSTSALLRDPLGLDGRRTAYGRGEEIYGEQEPADFVYRVVSGVVRTCKTLSDGRRQIAALNQDGTINSPSNPAVRGQVIQIFGTGQGLVANAPPDGQPSTGLLPTPVNPQILLGASFVPDANITYSGLAPSEIAVWQINFTIPATATSGNNVPIRVLMNSIPNDNPSNPGQIATTIAVK